MNIGLLTGKEKEEALALVVQKRIERLNKLRECSVDDIDTYAKDNFQKGYEAGMRDAVKYGSWGSCGHGVVKCSRCGKRFYGVYDDDRFDNYCRNCGAKMGGLICD